MPTIATTSDKNCTVEFKSTTFSTPVLRIFSNDLPQVQQQITAKIAQAPKFFQNSPIIVDLQNIAEPTLDLAKLIDFLRHSLLFPISICGGSAVYNTVALQHHIPQHALQQQPKTLTAPTKNSPVEEHIPAVGNKLITQQVRSGQRIYAKGDLIVLSNVGAGAEVIADGNIHIYGALRGRALAGATGDICSRIFCTLLDAELISIGGYYKTNEEMGTITTQPVQIYLQKIAIVIEAL